MSTSRAAFRRTGKRRNQRVWQRATYAFIAVWCLFFAPLEFWGLPTDRYDETLFGGASPWPAEAYEIEQSLDERRTRASGADTDLDPIAGRDTVVHLTATPADRAAILRRYRLFSRQPDEMITFMALQRMNPRGGDLDPQLYQYGGAYIYLVGAAIAVMSIPGYTTISGNAAQFLTDPAQFAHFYVVSRFITLGFGVLLMLMIGKLAARLINPPARLVAVISVALTPVFIAAVSEAKPHLPSAAFLITAVWFVCEYIRTGRVIFAYLTGAAAGLSFSFVLTGLAAFCCFLPLLFNIAQTREDKLARVRLQRGPLITATFIGLAVFAVTNFYFVWNLLFHRELVFGNIDNSTAMYAAPAQHPIAGFFRTIALLHECVGWIVPAIGLFGVIVLCVRRPRSGLVLAAPAVAFILAAAFLAYQKPAEFGRFLLVPSLVLVFGATQVFCAFLRQHPWLPVVGIAQFLIASGTIAYVRSLHTDMKQVNESRTAAARWIEANVATETPIALLQEPAPYAVPPIDFANRDVYLLPPANPPAENTESLPAYLVFTADNVRQYENAWWRDSFKLLGSIPQKPATNQITWANKPVYLFERKD